MNELKEQKINVEQDLNTMTEEQLLAALDALKPHEAARREALLQRVEQMMGREKEEAEFKRFCDPFCASLDTPSEKAEDKKQEVLDRREGIRHLAAIALDMPENSSWAALADIGGYRKYLQRVEKLPQYKHHMDDDERYVNANVRKDNKDAGREVVSPTNVSGLTIFKGEGSENGPIVDKVLLSVTKNKKWSHQPFGGKRNKEEGAVAALVREFGEEAGWDSAIKLMRSLKAGKVFYVGRYVTEDKKLFIQSFGLRTGDVDTKDIVSGSDSKGAIWADAELLERNDVTLTEQAEQYMARAFRFNRPISKYTRWHDGYYGDPWNTEPARMPWWEKGMRARHMRGIKPGESLFRAGLVDEEVWKTIAARGEAVTSEYNIVREIIDELAYHGFRPDFVKSYREAAEGIYKDTEKRLKNGKSYDNAAALAELTRFHESLDSLLKILNELVARVQRELTGAVSEFAQRTTNESPNNAFSVNPNLEIADMEKLLRRAVGIVEQEMKKDRPPSAADDLRALQAVIADEKLLREIIVDKSKSMSHKVADIRRALPKHLATLRRIETTYGAFKGMQFSEDTRARDIQREEKKLVAQSSRLMDRLRSLGGASAFDEYDPRGVGARGPMVRLDDGIQSKRWRHRRAIDAIEGKIPKAERDREREFEKAQETLDKRMRALDPRIPQMVVGVFRETVPPFVRTVSALLGVEGEQASRFAAALTTYANMHPNWQLTSADIRTAEGFAKLKQNLQWDDAIKTVEAVAGSLKNLNTNRITDGKYWLNAGKERIVCKIDGNDFKFFVPEYMVLALDNEQPGIGARPAEGVRTHSGTYGYLSDAVEWMNRGFLKREYRLAVPGINA